MLQGVALKCRAKAGIRNRRGAGRVGGPSCALALLFGPGQTLGGAGVTGSDSGRTGVRNHRGGTVVDAACLSASALGGVREWLGLGWHL